MRQKRQEHFRINVSVCKEQNQSISFSPLLQLTDVHVYLSAEIVRAMTYVINQGMAMYWGTSRWTAMEIMVSKKGVSFIFLITFWSEFKKHSNAPCS